MSYMTPPGLSSVKDANWIQTFETSSSYIKGQLQRWRWTPSLPQCLRDRSNGVKILEQLPTLDWTYQLLSRARALGTARTRFVLVYLNQVCHNLTLEIPGFTRLLEEPGGVIYETTRVTSNDQEASYDTSKGGLSTLLQSQKLEFQFGFAENLPQSCPAFLRRGNPRQREAIRGGARQSEAARGNLRQCEAIRGSARQSEAARGNPRRREAIRGSPRQSEAVRGNPRQREAIRGSARQSEAARGNPRRREAIRGSPRQSEAARGNPRQPEAIRGSARQSEAARGNPRQCEAIRGSARQSEAVRGNPRQCPTIT
ncbi:hypothetical protein V9T40_003077 [Parthenolecanium corni]|uniref:Uncharacterized protein n=1 Tax=Parthenolecanium corni TaxID=536013 RepID=A0AAN9Y7P1_9HEMI